MQSKPRFESGQRVALDLSGHVYSGTVGRSYLVRGAGGRGRPGWLYTIYTQSLVITNAYERDLTAEADGMTTVAVLARSRSG